jgi:pimeloyl-ACP methyl ester carboxylesterase
MTGRTELRDVVVILPGITGSQLSVDDNPVWALGGKSIALGLISLGKRLDKLRLPDGEGYADDLRVTAPALMTDLHVIPGLWSPIKGYDRLTSFFAQRFGASPEEGNLLAFPYDWRLSNEVAAKRLLKTVEPVLERWRERHADAQLVLVCHSMGGLVARWFLDVLGGHELTRWLITIGTPYAGSVKALGALVNGLPSKLGPLGPDLTALVRSFPSVYELLPTNECYFPSTGGSTPVTLAEANGLGLDVDRAARAAAFHARLDAAVAARAERGYDVLAVKGIEQPTLAYARGGAGGLTLLPAEHAGDGTVPRLSAHPQEWADENAGRAVANSQRHASLQDADDVHLQIQMKLNSPSAGAMMGGPGFGIEVPELLAAGEPLVVTATSREADTPLWVTVTPHGGPGPLGPPRVMDPLGEGGYELVAGTLGPGVYEVAVATHQAMPEPVADVVVVWEP